MRHLFTGQNLRKLFCATGRVFGGDHPQRNVVGICQHCTQHRNGLRFVVFNADQHLTRLENMRQDANAFHNLRRAILHQPVVGSDIGFALCGIND